MSTWAQTPAAPLLQPFADAPDGAPPAPWRVVGLPGNKVPLVAPDITTLDGQHVLRLRSDKSYGTVSHAVPPDAGARFLQWQWRLDQALTTSNLRRKDGDDAALKVCALFDLPLEKIPFVERNLLRLARRVSGEALPGATLCYVWDTSLPAGTLLANAYTGRVRLRILNSGTDGLGQWHSPRRDLQADFMASFGDEADTVPPLLAIVLGSDSDNTGGASLGFVKDLLLMKQ
nr:DUF3047 domain-containing protein [uncultured Rhodoferax sp.]